jgi:hypothetical protein
MTPSSPDNWTFREFMRPNPIRDAINLARNSYVPFTEEDALRLEEWQRIIGREMDQAILRSFRQAVGLTPPDPEWTVEVSTCAAWVYEYQVLIRGPIRTSLKIDANLWTIHTDGDRMRLANEIIERVLPRPDGLTVDEWDVLRHHRIALNRQLHRLFRFERQARQQRRMERETQNLRNMGMARNYYPGALNALPSLMDPYWNPPPATPTRTCAECQKAGLTEWFTSKQDYRDLCQACFDQRADKGLAREAGQPLKTATTKKRHPLDAWMDQHAELR